MKRVRKTYSGYFRAAEALVALAIFVFPSISTAQGLKIDLLDGTNCRLFQDSTKKGLSISKDSVAFLANSSYLRHSYEIDYENRLLANHCYYALDKEEYSPVSYRVFELSSAAVSRGEVRSQSDWGAAKRSSLGKFSSGKGGRGLLNFDIPFKFPKVLSSLLGEGGPGLQVNGNYRVMFKLEKTPFTSGVANIGVNRQRGTPSFQTQQEYNMNITGNVGSKLFVNMKSDKRANIYQQRVDLADRIQIRYKGNEEDLVQSIEAGNTTLSLGGSRFAGFSQSVQGLFGLKAQGKLGGINWTAITSQQKGNSQSKSFRAGAEATTVRIREKDYLRYTHFDLGKRQIAKPKNNNGLPAFTDEFRPGIDSLVDLLLFKAEQYNPSEQGLYPPGKCYVTPPESVAEAIRWDSLCADTTCIPCRPGGDTCDAVPAISFRWLAPEKGEYFLNRDSFYVRFNYPLTSGDIIGAMMLVYRKDSTKLVRIGFPVRDTSKKDQDSLRYVLKLIKRPNVNVDKADYYYAWKNVYDLRERDIDADGFSVSIYHGRQGEESDPNRKDYQGDTGVKYIRILGLDRFLTTGVAGKDDKIDLNGTVVDQERGYIIFPDRYPFDADSNYVGVGDSSGVLQPKVPEIYGNNPTEAGQKSQYYLEIKTASRRTEFALGQVNILDGSEDVRLNGQKLIRGQDYQIDYELGQIRFFNRQVADPNADVQINYEYTPFLAAQKKNLFGIRTEYAPSEELKFGSTLLYRNESTIDQKPRIGEEPSHTLLADADFSYTSQSKFITKLVDKLPGVSAVTPSAFQLDGELARSMPNPNTLGKAFIDDFEGSRDFTNLAILREIWTKSSPPAGRNNSNRGGLFWFSPGSGITDPGIGRVVERFRVLEIFPSRKVPTADERTDVLDLRFLPDSANKWGGIMRAMPVGLQNHLETQLLDFWVGLEKGKPLPRLHFDFGQISEDINVDNNLQSEDLPPKNGIVSPEEDKGLFRTDSVWGTDIYHINGTKGNAGDPGRLNRPDVEDLDNDNSVESNNYFSFVIDSAAFQQRTVPGSLRDNNGDRSQFNEVRPLEWRELRIPLKDTTLEGALYTKVGGGPDWSNIQHVRIWVDGVAETTRVIFATLELVGNRWKELKVSSTDTLLPVQGDEKIRVSVINTQEHPTYRPPPGVTEVRNRITNLDEREQSLVLSYENVRPKHQALVQRVLLGNAEDYTGYKTLKMFVHGDEGLTSSDSLRFFLRFGSGTQNDPNNFYEFRVFPLRPDWPGNEIKIDFDTLTNLKNRLIKINQERQQRRDTLIKSLSEGSYFVTGNPSLAAVRWYVMGVQNLNSDTAGVTGEVWTDELLLTDVRKEAGMAGRLHFSTQLSDFGQINLDYSRVGATFRSLSATDRSGSLSFNRGATTNEQIGFSGSFQAHKLLPRFLGITGLPISVSWSRNRSTPRLKTGSDIVLSRASQAAERSESVQRGFTITPSLRRETKNWLWNLTFNRMNGSFSYSYGRSSNPFTLLAETRSYQAGLGYDLSPKKGIGFKPFGWLPSFWLLKRVEKTSFSPLPATLNLNGSISRTLSTNIQNDSKKTTTSSYVRDFDGRLNSSFRLFPNLTADYNFSTHRDLSDPNNLKFSFNPHRFQLGLEVAHNQDFKAGYNPGLFSFADTRLSFSSSYQEAGGRRSYSDGSRHIQAGSNYGTTITFNLSRFLGQKKAASPAEQRARQQEEENQKKKKEAEAKKKAEKVNGGKGETLTQGPVRSVNDSTVSKTLLPTDSSGPASPSGKAVNADSIRRTLGIPAGLPLSGKNRPDSARTTNDTTGGNSSTFSRTPSSADSVRKAGGDSPVRGGTVDTSVSKKVGGQAPADSSRKSAQGQAKAKPSGGGGGVFLISDVLDLLRSLAAKIDPVQFGYTHGNQLTAQLKDRPGLAFQFGLTDSLPKGLLSNANNSRSNSDNYTMGSGLNLGSGANFDAHYSKRATRAFTSAGTIRTESQVFPDISFNLSGLERRVGFLKKILPAGSLSSNFQKQTSKTFDVRTGKPNDISTNKAYNPLISISSTFSRGLSGNFSYSKGIQSVRSFVGSTVSQTSDNTFNLSTRYSFLAPKGIRFPFLRGIRLASSLNSTLGVRYSRRTTRNPNPNAVRGGVTADYSDLSVAPQLSYSFSTQVDGGLTVTWQDHTDHVAKRSTHVRSAQFWVDLKF